MNTIRKLNWQTLPLALVALCLVAAVANADSSEYAREWGPQVGTPMPPIHAPSASLSYESLDSLMGPNGLLIFFNRSADW